MKKFLEGGHLCFMFLLCQQTELMQLNVSYSFSCISGKTVFEVQQSIKSQRYILHFFVSNFQSKMTSSESRNNMDKRKLPLLSEGFLSQNI